MVRPTQVQFHTRDTHIRWLIRILGESVKWKNPIWRLVKFLKIQYVTNRYSRYCMSKKSWPICLVTYYINGRRLLGHTVSKAWISNSAGNLIFCPWTFWTNMENAISAPGPWYHNLFVGFTKTTKVRICRLPPLWFKQICRLPPLLFKQICRLPSRSVDYQADL